jgi:hypothetical protein
MPVVLIPKGKCSQNNSTYRSDEGNPVAKLVLPASLTDTQNFRLVERINLIPAVLSLRQYTIKQGNQRGIHGVYSTIAFQIPNQTFGNCFYLPLYPKRFPVISGMTAKILVAGEFL